MPEDGVQFGVGLGGWNGTGTDQVAEVMALAAQADAQGLDLVTTADHPYFADRLDAYAGRRQLSWSAPCQAVASPSRSTARPIACPASRRPPSLRR